MKKKYQIRTELVIAQRTLIEDYLQHSIINQSKLKVHEVESPGQKKGGLILYGASNIANIKELIIIYNLLRTRRGLRTKLYINANKLQNLYIKHSKKLDSQVAENIKYQVRDRLAKETEIVPSENKETPENIQTQKRKTNICSIIRYKLLERLDVNIKTREVINEAIE